MTALRRDPVALVVAFVAGVLVGLRTLQVMDHFYAEGSYLTVAATGTLAGFGVTLAVVVGFAIWRSKRAPEGPIGQRLAALAAGMIAGAVAGAVLVGLT